MLNRGKVKGCEGTAPKLRSSEVRQALAQSLSPSLVLTQVQCRMHVHMKMRALVHPHGTTAHTVQAHVALQSVRTRGFQ